jgi:hypothetical protein
LNSIDPLGQPGAEHLGLLVDYIKETYAGTTQRVHRLLQNGDTTYDLLWALFKPNTVAYTTCAGTQKPRGIKYESGEERTMSNGVEYFHIKGRYLDFDGKALGEVSIATGILKFRGSKPITSLEIFPLQYHPSKNQVEANLINCGRKFLSLTGVQHLQYEGKAFQMKKGEAIAMSVESKIMVDHALFLKTNPNYSRPSINQVANKRLGDSDIVDLWDLFDDDPASSQPDQVKLHARDLGDAKDEDLLICSPTVLGFSLHDKLWCMNPLPAPLCSCHKVCITVLT